MPTRSEEDPLGVFRKEQLSIKGDFRGVARIVHRQIIRPDRSVVAVAERNLWLITQPRMVIGTYVPEMVVGV
jgi:hypothetical protein